MKHLQITYVISTISLLLILSSCSSSGDFSKRKYRKGIFKEHSVRVKRDRTKQKETYISNNIENTKSEHIEINELKQSGLTRTVDSTQNASKVISESTVNKQEIKTRNKNSRIENKTKPKEKKKKKELTSSDRIHRSTINGYFSVFSNLLFGTLATFIFLNAFIALVIVLAILFFTMVGTTIASLADLKRAKDQGVEESMIRKYRRAYILNIVGLALLFLGLLLCTVLALTGAFL
jgi:cation transport ATPase